ncbi:hypothetical protein J5N97_002348 [Dioscorea zingiberensis]|uniref:DUF4378 domain-containing protein n=1 Tax=Dioscorea zingiberensis TaxID=325984 RepID=A0A9D5D3X5_9LILI|nr:hypothetical protein J5N97_002348 [Dioscorea zingiberensis]
METSEQAASQGSILYAGEILMGCFAVGVEVLEGEPDIPRTEEEHDSLCEGVSPPIKDNVKISSKASSKTRMRTPLFKKKRREQDQKRKISPLAARLLRTVSIHHMQCNDYVLPDDLTSNKDASTVELNPHDISSSPSGGHLPLMLKVPDKPISGKQCEVCGFTNSAHFVDHNQLEEFSNFFMKKQLLLREELNEVKEALLKQDKHSKESRDDVAIRSKGFLHMVELLNANKELLLKVVQDPKLILAKDIQDHSASRSSAALSKSCSFPVVAGVSRVDNDRLPQLRHKRMESEPSTSQECKLQVEYSPSDLTTINEGSQVVKLEDGDAVDSLEKETNILKKQRNDRTALNRFKDIKRRIKYVIKDSSRERHRISMDSILHKIPYGLKVSNNVSKGVVGSWQRCASESLVGDSSSCLPNSKYANKQIRRSRSLTESLDRYSSLLESISSREPNKLPERLQPMKTDSNLHSRKSPGPLERIFSLPEFESYTLNDNEHSRGHNASLSLDFQALDSLDDSFLVDMDDYDELRPVGDAAESDRFLERIIEVDDQLTVHRDLEIIESTSEQDQDEQSIIPNDITAEGNCFSSQHEMEAKTQTNKDYVQEESHLLQKVWANISWHLSSQMQEDEPIEYLVARHYARNDGWMNLQYETETVGLELEDLILDDLLDEAVYQFCKSYCQ